MLGPAAFIEALERFDEARLTFIERLHSSVQDRNRWIKAGGAFLSAGRPDEAIQAYEAAIRLAPHDAHAWVLKAKALIQSGRRKEAASAYEQSLRLEPNAHVEATLKQLRQDDPKPGD